METKPWSLVHFNQSFKIILEALCNDCIFIGWEGNQQLHFLKIRANQTERAVSPEVEEVMEYYTQAREEPKPLPKSWVPKNHDIRIPVAKDIPLTGKQWQQSNFPSLKLPAEIETNVNTKVWKDKIAEIHHEESNSLDLPILMEVLANLELGCNSEVQPPGTNPTESENYFPDPDIDIPRIADAIASEIKAGHMAGPFEPGSIEGAKVNGFISIKKPSGARRQVGNLSAPKGLSFNEHISPAALNKWKVKATTSSQFAEMLTRAGRDAIMSCSDMVNAYKNLPVAKAQRRSQVFKY